MCTASDDVFAVPEMGGTENTYNYKFAFTVPVEAGTQRLNIDILDYPGGNLGTSKFVDEVMPHLNASSVLLIPIPADILMEWKRTDKINNTHAKKVNILARCMLDVADVVSVIKDWAARRAQQDETSLLIFVPIRCEAYFNDNGGSKDESEILHEAVQNLYVDALNLSPEMKKMIQIEIQAVDTYGIVELRDISLVGEDGREQLVSSFRKRLHCRNEVQAKGAFEVLSTIIRFRLNGFAKQLGVKREELENQIASRSFLEKILVWFYGDAAKKNVVEYIRKYDGAFQAMTVVSKLSTHYPARQRVLNELEG